MTKFNSAYTGTEIDNLLSSTETEHVFNEDIVRFLLPDSLYFIKEEILPVYSRGILSLRSTIPGKLYFINATSVPQTVTFNPIDEVLYINPATLQNTTSFEIRQNTTANKRYYKSISTVVTDPATKTGATPKILFIGDSLTYGYIPKKISDKLTGYSVSPTLVGTQTSSGDVSTEGRAGWAYRNFIGLDNVAVDYTITLAPTGSTVLASENPFLKVATETDKTNHPTWCFRYSGSETELSYASDTDKTGDFYIFDFRYYLDNHGVADPDVVTIGLSVNDISFNTFSSALAGCKLGLEIMLTQIKAACPNAKICIIPTSAIGEASNSTWENSTSVWIENCITDVATLSLSDVFISPVYVHMNPFYSFSPASTANLSDVNNETVGTVTEYVHPNDYGVTEYVNALTSCVLSMI